MYVYAHIDTVIWLYPCRLHMYIAISRENAVTYPEPEIGVATCKTIMLLLCVVV